MSISAGLHAPAEVWHEHRAARDLHHSACKYRVVQDFDMKTQTFLASTFKGVQFLMTSYFFTVFGVSSWTPNPTPPLAPCVYCVEPLAYTW